MSLLSQPGVQARNLVRVQPVKMLPGADPDVDTPVPTPVGPEIRVHSEKLTSAQSYREGKQEQTISYVLYADHRRGRSFVVGEKDMIWHPKGSERNPDGTPNYWTALEIDSVVEYDDEGVVRIDAGRTG